MAFYAGPTQQLHAKQEEIFSLNFCLKVRSHCFKIESVSIITVLHMCHREQKENLTGAAGRGWGAPRKPWITVAVMDRVILNAAVIFKVQNNEFILKKV